MFEAHTKNNELKHSTEFFTQGDSRFGLYQISINDEVAIVPHRNALYSLNVKWRMVNPHMAVQGYETHTQNSYLEIPTKNSNG